MSPTNKETWNIWEQEVVDLVACPNCQKPLMLLPPNYPLYDLQCTGCSFRAQVKTINHKPSALFFWAGRDIMEKVLKSGFMVPALFANFKWKEKWVEHQEIKFYPFVPKKHLRKYQLSETARRANYKMFHYQNMDIVPHFIVYQK